MEYVSNEAQLFCFSKMNFFDLQKVGNFFIYLKHFGICNWLIIKLATKVLTNEIKLAGFPPTTYTTQINFKSICTTLFDDHKMLLTRFRDWWVIKTRELVEYKIILAKHSILEKIFYLKIFLTESNWLGLLESSNYFWTLIKENNGIMNLKRTKVTLYELHHLNTSWVKSLNGGMSRSL